MSDRPEVPDDALDPQEHLRPRTKHTQGLGGTVIAMEKFDASECLALIQRYKVTHGQFVPTMFVRMLKLDEFVRKSYDVSSIKRAELLPASRSISWSIHAS